MATITANAKPSEYESYFTANSYVKGSVFSGDDVDLLGKIKEEPDFDVHPCFSRWYKHIKAILNNKELKALYGVNEEEDDINLFGDDEDDEMEKLREERAKEAAEKKKKDANKPVAKSLVVLDVKPWDDSTDLEEMKLKVTSIEQDGLVWGTSSFEPLSYGIKKLRIACVVEDEKVSIDALSAQIEEFSDHVQSVDVASFNKI